jgi:hypothetical protein
MNTSPTQIHLIYKLESMRKIVANVNHLPSIIAIAQKVYDITFPVPIGPSFKYKIEGKERTLNQLQQEIRLYSTSKTEIEVVQFQLASTIMILMLQFIDGTLEEMRGVLTGEQPISTILAA